MTEMRIVGRSEDGAPIINGDFLLYMKDTHGIPLSISCMWLEERGWGYEVEGLIRACLDNRNYSLDRTLRLIREHVEPEHHAKFHAVIKKVLEELEDE